MITMNSNLISTNNQITGMDKILIHHPSKSITFFKDARDLKINQITIINSQ